MTTKNFQGTSQAGDFQAALSEATNKALQDLSGNESDIRITWKLIEISGSKGGFSGEETITVTIEANKHEVIKVPGLDLFIVIALTNTNTKCSIVSIDAAYPAIYSQVYGPASHDDCKAWVANNCDI